MGEIVMSLALLSYGTAAIVGMHLSVSAASRLYGFIVHRDHGSYVDRATPQAMVGDMVLIVLGLLLLLQGVVVLLWTFD